LVAEQRGELSRQPIDERHWRVVRAVDSPDVPEKGVPGHVERPELQGAVAELRLGPRQHVFEVGAVENPYRELDLLGRRARSPSAVARQHGGLRQCATPSDMGTAM
jgi:hypothetical protein